MAQEHPNLNRNTQAAKKKRLQLIEEMGGSCADCGESRVAKLEFDHPHGRDYEPNKLSYRARINRYEREFRAGLLALRCQRCNLLRRPTDEHGCFINTATATAISEFASRAADDGPKYEEPY